MCRADVTQPAAPLLATILDTMARQLAEQAGVRREDVAIGPVDFGEEGL